MRINLFTVGDCTDLNTWSNLPYYLYQNLRTESVSVRPINLLPLESPSYRGLARATALTARVIRRLRPGYEYGPFRSRWHRALINRRLNVTAKQHRDVDLNVFLTFTFSSYRYVDLPVVHYCDRTYEHHLEETGVLPTTSARAYMRVDRRNIENADLVLTTNQPCCDFITSHYRPKRAFCLKPGINTDTAVNDPQRLIQAKEHSNDILFIGRGVYRRGVDILIRAFGLLNELHHQTFTLHVIGVDPSELPRELGTFDSNIRFYKYLDRSVPADREQYECLLRSARLFVMPMRPGPFPGAISEAQLYCTPVVASNVWGMAENLTHECDSVLVKSLEPRDFAYEMDRLIRDTPRWRRLAEAAHASRMEATWANTVKRFLSIVRESDLVR